MEKNNYAVSLSTEGNEVAIKRQTIYGDATWKELMEAFADALRGAGYHWSAEDNDLIRSIYE